ncbi:eotaxin-like [Astyanax mexicanus]|uniref:Eotaxin-like n=1 Tax=Astyanax mexicanus TaxID=7994 RepID=A0A8T2LY96_ASTMX|nr:eotaxin-like [Astyanax mexicanus]
MMLSLVAVFLFAMQWRTIVLMGPPLSCCPVISGNKIPVKNIVDYALQESPPCPVKAVRFTTIKGKSICSDPESTWSKQVIKELDSKKRSTTTIKPLQGDGPVTVMEPTTKKYHQTKNTPSFTKLNEEESSVKETESPSSSVNELPTIKYTSFCLEEEPAESTNAYF